ncbi:pyridoxal phosphate-dependent aminotransferase [Candidatus Sulcia muelleri]|uniref:pyridoxal phosphate-dependent aminotransferase n=1 Tax=Candidatus Karelsulcia muelleri TaxID=336810 RepID=UPI000BDBD032|nr:pyridoxal phosphate-dependent aminotransferase [Candidatus Karelsulcia muelleri]NHU72549.1 pyridoxal phosphate-dependent aminotransferase [Candidatus Karelsulcia muelleri]
MLSDRILNMGISKTLEMTAKARKLKELGYNVINLSVGEPDFLPPSFILKAAKKAIDKGYHNYTPISGDLELKKMICNKFKRDNNLNYSNSQILISNGVKQSIINLFLALLNKNDEVIIPAPYWVSYYEMVKFCQAKPIILPTTIKSNFKITSKQLKNVITSKTKIFIFNSPCNPTGCVYSKNELKTLVKIFSKNPKIIIISDEIYEYIIYEKKHISIASFSEIYNQTVTLNGLSKSFSMTGWRVGYLGGPEWLTKACEKIQGQTTSCVNSIAQRASIVALKYNQKKILKKILNSFKKRRNLIITFFQEIPTFKFKSPDGAFYLFIDISFFLKKNQSSNNFSMHLLNKYFVATVSGESFGYKNGLRISYASSKKNLFEALFRIKKFLNEFFFF